VVAASQAMKTRLNGTFGSAVLYTYRLLKIGKWKQVEEPAFFYGESLTKNMTFGFHGGHNFPYPR
jgi:hypothetical protein